MKIFLFLLSFFVFLSVFSYPLGTGDGPEIITTSYLLSIAHPPGYPLYILLAKLFTQLPVCDISFRIIIFSIFLSSLSLILIYSLAKKISGDLPAIISIFILAFSEIFFRLSLIAEVYSLSIFLFVLLLFISTFSYKDYLFFFLLGITASHSFYLLIFFPCFIILLFKEKKSFSKKYILLYLLLFLIGFIPCLYIPIRSLKDYSLQRFDTSNLKSFLDFVQANGFQEISLDPVRYKKLLPSILFFFVSQFTYLGALFIIYGFYYSFKKKSHLAKIFLLIIFINIIFSLPALFSFDIKYFLLPAIIVFSLFLSFGIKSIFEHKNVLSKCFLIIFIVFGIFNFFKNYKEVKLIENPLIYNYGKNILHEVKENSIIIASNSSTYFSFSLLYFEYVEKLRSDVALIYPMYCRSRKYLEYIKNKYPWITISPYAKNLSSLNEENCFNLLPKDFFNFYYTKYPFMKFLNNISGEKISKGILNHYRCLYIAQDIIEKNSSKLPVYLLNNEIYETPGCNIKNNFLLVPQKYTFQLLKKQEKPIFPYQKIFVPKIYDEETKNIYSNLILERAKSFLYLEKLDLAKKEYNMAKKIKNPPMTFEELLEENYRGISDFAMGEFLKR